MIQPEGEQPHEIKGTDFQKPWLPPELQTPQYTEALDQNRESIRRIVSPFTVTTELPVYYPASGGDIAKPIALTNARNYIFDDTAYVHPEAQTWLEHDIRKIGGKDIMMS